MSTSWRPNAAGSSSLGPVTHPTRAVTFQSIHYVAPETGEIWSRFGEANLRWIHDLDLDTAAKTGANDNVIYCLGEKKKRFSVHCMEDVQAIPYIRDL